MNLPTGIVLDSSGNIYIADQSNFRVRKVTGTTISTVAGNGTQGYSGNGGSPTGAELNAPAGVALDSSGNLYIADAGNYVVWKISSSKINVIAGKNGNGAGFGGDTTTATSALLNNPSGVAVDSGGNVYIADPANWVVRVVCANTTPLPCAGLASGVINTFAGYYSAGYGYAGDGGLATAAQLGNPVGVALDSAGNLYIADSDNHVIRKVTLSTGIITTVAGNGQATNSVFNPVGDGGPATQASLNTPKGVAVDANGYIYIADTNNSLIRVVEPNGVIFTIAGDNTFTLGPGYSGDGGLAKAAQLQFPSGVAVSGGKVYIADAQNNRIRLLTPILNTPAIGSGGVISASDFGAFSAVAPGSFIEIYGTNLANDTASWSSSFSGSNAPTSLDGVTVTVGGKPAFVEFVSANQINVQVPSGVTAGPQSVVVTNWSAGGPAASVTVNETQPGFYAPSFLKIGGNQYVGALTTDFSSWILPAGTGTVANRSSAPAKPGDTIILYGVGFGPVSPSTIVDAGQIVSQQNSLTNTFQISIGGAPAKVSYAGLAPGYVGLYQFNIVVPSIDANAAAPVTFTLGGVAGAQTLYTAVGN